GVIARPRASEDQHPAISTGLTCTCPFQMETKPTLQTRRKFLRTSMLGAAATWTLPVFLEKTFVTLDAMAADTLTQTVTGKDGTILIVVQMAGGNDGLNTVVPYADDAYYRVRPRLGLL